MSRLSRSVNVIRTDTQLAIYDFLLVIYSNHGPISYHFRENGDFCRKLQISPTRVFKVPTNGVLIGIL